MSSYRLLGCTGRTWTRICPFEALPPATTERRGLQEAESSQLRSGSAWKTEVRPYSFSAFLIDFLSVFSSAATATAAATTLAHVIDGLPRIFNRGFRSRRRGRAFKRSIPSTSRSRMRAEGWRRKAEGRRRKAECGGRRLKFEVVVLLVRADPKPVIGSRCASARSRDSYDQCQLSKCRLSS